jgi:hypothetical protein
MASVSTEGCGQRLQGANPNEGQVDPKMHGDANHAIKAAPELPAGPDAKKNNTLPMQGKGFT